VPGEEAGLDLLTLVEESDECAVRPGSVHRDNEPVASVVETLAAVTLDQVGMVVANDSARSSFSIVSGGDLLAVDADLNVLHRWALGSAKRGRHSSSPRQGLALISGPDEVRLLGSTGQTIWAYPHSAWSGAFESGCTWFDAAGDPYAVIPAPSYDHCLVVRFDLESGTPRGEAAICATPTGIEPVHGPWDWVGLSEGEGQDAARAWWVRSATSPDEASRIEVLDAGWDHWVLCDATPDAGVIITTPHGNGPLAVRSFPTLDVLLSIDPPGGEFWDRSACFAGAGLIAGKLVGPGERLVAIDLNGEVHDLAEREQGCLIPAAGNTWLSATRTTIQRRRFTLSYQQRYDW
jgi:hypothetical protein